MKVGIGYLFGAKDDGLKKVLKDTKTGLADVDDSAGKATTSGGRLRDILLGLQTLELSKLVDQIDNISSTLDKATGGGPSGGLESRFQQERTEFDKTFRQIAVTSGIMGDDLEKLEGKAFSMAKGLNRDMETIGKALVDFKRRGLTPEDVGLDTFEDLIKVSEVSGLAVDQLAVEVKGLQKSYGGTKEDVAGFLDRFTAVAQKAGIADEALKGLPGILRVIDDEFAKSVGAETVQDVENVALSIVKLSSGFEELGVAPGDAIESAKGLFKTLFSESEATDKMMAGLQDNFGDLANELTLVDGRGFTDVMKTLEDLKHDPAAFAMELQKVNSQLAESGNEVFQKRFAETIGGMDTNLKFLIESGLDLGKIFGDLQKETDGAEGAFKRLGDQGFRTGRTLEERMALAKDTLEDTFLALGRPQVVKMVDAQTAAYGRLGDALKIVAKGVSEEDRAKGLTGIQKAADKLNKLGFGPLVDAASAFAAGGILAVIFGNQDQIPDWAMGLELVFDMAIDGLLMLAPVVGAAVVGMGALATAMPLITAAFGAVGSAITGVVGFFAALIPSLTTLVPILIAAAGGVFVFQKALDGSLGPAAQKAAGAMENLLDPVLNFGTGLLEKVTTFFDGLDPAALIDGFVNWIGGALGMAGDALPEAEIDGAATGATDKLLEAFISAVGSIQGFGQRFFTEVSGRLSKAYDDAGGWKGILGFMLGKASSLGNMFIENLKAVDYAGIVTELVGYFTTALTKAGELRSRVSAWFRGLIEGINMAEVFQALLGMRDTALGFITQYLETAAEKISSVDWAGLGEQIGTTVMEFLFGAAEDDMKTNATIFSKLAEYFAEGLKAMGTREFWTPIGKSLVAGLTYLWSLRTAFADFFGGLLKGLGKVVFNALFGPETTKKIFDGLKKVSEVMANVFTTVKTVAVTVFNAIKGAVGAVAPTFWSIVDGTKSLWDGLVSLKDKAVEVFQGMAEYIAPVVDAVMGIVYSLVGGGEGGGLSIWDAVDSVKSAFGSLKDVAFGVFDGFMESAEELLGDLPDKFSSAFETIKGTVESVMDGILTFFSKAWSKVTSSLGAVGTIVGTLADKFGLTGSDIVSTPTPTPTLPPAPEGSLAQKKLLAQDDAKLLVQTLQGEFGKQNEILLSINRGIASIRGAGGGGGGVVPEKPTNAETIP